MMVRDVVEDGFGVLVIRVWHEPDSEKPFRARLIYGGVDQENSAGATATDPDDVVEAVRRWLDERTRQKANS
jgi:hypothetical protein